MLATVPAMGVVPVTAIEQLVPLITELNVTTPVPTLPELANAVIVSPAVKPIVVTMPVMSAV